MVVITNRPSFAAIADRHFTLVDGKFRQIEKPTVPAHVAVGGGGGAA